MTKILPKELKEFGEEVLRHLDTTNYTPKSMLWTDTIKEGQWILVIAIKFLDDNKSISRNRILYFRDQAHSRIMSAVSELQGPEISFVIAAHDEPFIRLIGQLVSTESDAISSISFNNNTIDGQNTGNNYIYRISL